MTAPRGGRRGRLAGRVVLVVGAGDPGAQAVALRLSALGAALVLAGPALPPVLLTAGFAAASGATARVVEEPSPPLLGAALMDAAGRALAPATDAVVAAAAFATLDAAREALAGLAAALPPGAEAILVDAKPAGGSKAFAAAVGDRLLARVAAEGGPVPPRADEG